MTIKKMKQWIDSASYEELLRKWRFEPPPRDTSAGVYTAVPTATPLPGSATAGRPQDYPITTYHTPLTFGTIPAQIY